MRRQVRVIVSSKEVFEIIWSSSTANKLADGVARSAHMVMRILFIYASLRTATSFDGDQRGGILTNPHNASNE